MPVGFCALHQCTSNGDVWCIDKHMKAFCPVGRLYEWYFSEHFLQTVVSLLFNCWLLKWCLMYHGVKKCRDIAKYLIIQLCHLTWPKNRLSALAFVGGGASIRTFTLSGSTAMPSWLTICPNHSSNHTSHSYHTHTTIFVSYSYVKRLRVWLKSIHDT